MTIRADGLERLSPRLRVICNGDAEVNGVRAQLSAAVEAEPTLATRLGAHRMLQHAVKSSGGRRASGPAATAGCPPPHAHWRARGHAAGAAGAADRSTPPAGRLATPPAGARRGTAWRTAANASQSSVIERPIGIVFTDPLDQHQQSAIRSCHAAPDAFRATACSSSRFTASTDRERSLSGPCS